MPYWFIVESGSLGSFGDQSWLNTHRAQTSLCTNGSPEMVVTTSKCDKATESGLAESKLKNLG